MAIDGTRGPMDDPRERRPDRRPDPFARGPVSDPGDRRVWPPPGAGDRMVEADELSDAERLANVLDEIEQDIDNEPPAADRAREERARQDRQRIADERQRADEDRERDQDQDQQRDEQDRQRDQERQRADQERQLEQQRAEQERRERDDERADDRTGPLDAVAGPAAVVAAAELDRELDREPEREPDREPEREPERHPQQAPDDAQPRDMEDRPSRVARRLDNTPEKEWAASGVQRSSDDMAQTLDPENEHERREEQRQQALDRMQQRLDGQADPGRDERGADELDGQDAAGPAPAVAGATEQPQPDRGRSGRDEDYVGQHRAEEGPEQGGQQRAGDNPFQRIEGDLYDRDAPDRQHWAPPAADTQVRRDAGDGRPGQQQGQQRDDREGPDRQGRAAPARGPGRNQEQQRDDQAGRKLAAGGLAAAGKTIGGADALIESASPTGRAAVSQRWEYGRGTRPGDKALRKAMSLLDGQRSASEASRRPQQAPEAVPHSGAHTPGKFHERYQPQQQQQQQPQHRQQRGG